MNFKQSLKDKVNEHLCFYPFFPDTYAYCFHVFRRFRDFIRDRIGQGWDNDLTMKLLKDLVEIFIWIIKTAHRGTAFMPLDAVPKIIFNIYHG